MRRRVVETLDYPTRRDSGKERLFWSIAVSIIEDDASVRHIVAGWIKQAKNLRYVSEYGNPESALARLPEEKPDVVLVDINLAGLSGIHCVCRLKPLLPEDAVPHADGL